MKEFAILSDEILIGRRYPSVTKTRKDWKCTRCGVTVEKGDFIEHSYSADGKICIELCLPCVKALNKAK